MLPVEDWDNESRPHDPDGENLCYAKEFRKPCPMSAPPAPAHSTPKTPTSPSGESLLAKRVARRSADLVGLIADQFTHLAVFLIRESQWTETDRRLCALLMGIGMRLDRLAIKLLLRSR